MHLHYQDDLTGITREQLSCFCVGWKYPLNGEELYKILQNSYTFVLAVDGNRVVGFVNALSDGLKFAFIPMLEVLPDYKNQGIGTKLMTRLLDRLHDIQNIDLTCDIDLQTFYDKFGMLKSNGMVLRKYLTAEEAKAYRNNQ
mgnify:CR=1 FL=1